ncbi:MAG: lysophospholipid acyltransferase family protein [Chloroflexota bacterium]
MTQLVLYTIARVDVDGFENIPKEGGCLVISNHVGRLDTWLGFIMANRDDTIIMIADKYAQNRVLKFLGDAIDTIWVNRDGGDIRSLRKAQKRLKAGGLAVIAPEGTRSPTEALIKPKAGAAFLAGKAEVPIVPIALAGTEDSVVSQRLRRFRRLDLRIRVGKPFTLPPMPKRNKEQFVEDATEEMMCQIASLLPERYRGIYADKARVAELVEKKGKEIGH